MNTLKLAQKAAIVTGAARGIGAACAIELAANGADVLVADVQPESGAAATLDRIRAFGRRAEFLSGDVADPEYAPALVEQAVRAFGRLDIVVNNAGFGHRGAFIDMDVAGARRAMDVIFWGGFQVSQAGARQMVKQGQGGSIVFISSVHAERGYAGACTYNAAKSAINHLARSIALELASHRIRVNFIEPGWIDTPGEHIHFGDRFIEEHGKKLLWGRLGTPEEIARGVLFLASDDSSYMTGASLRIDGGYVLPAAYLL
jgi:glucose 1-dehydrogenase